MTRFQISLLLIQNILLLNVEITRILKFLNNTVNGQQLVVLKKQNLIVLFKIQNM